MTTPLQQFIADYLKDHPDDTLASIARRCDIKRSTIYAVARRDGATPEPETLEKLAKGLRVPEARLRELAGLGAGYGSAEMLAESPEIQLLISTVKQLTPERQEAVLRRARLLDQEQREERAARRKR